MRRILTKLSVLVIATAIALGIAEWAVRQLPSEPFVHHQEDENHGPLTFEAAVADGKIAVGQLPRGRALWAKEQTFYLCYSGKQRPYMDANGCVRIDINKHGLRDRADLQKAKPAGQRRVVCLGDSFTFGWGVDIDNVWPRLIEPVLTESLDGEVRSINCGSSGTLLLDECWWGLRDRFGAFEPDVVIQSICLNDLVPMPDVIALRNYRTVASCDLHEHRVHADCADCVTAVEAQRPGWLTDNSALWRLVTGHGSLDQELRLDPGVDWGRWLLDMPEDWIALDDAKLRNYYEFRDTPIEATWKGEGPQKALRASADWCAARGVRYGVVIWPLFQGLEAHYPFETLHAVVREYCAAQNIPVLDLLPTFKGEISSSLWVDPSDMHGNEVAHKMAAAPIADFVDGLLTTR